MIRYRTELEKEYLRKLVTGAWNHPSDRQSEISNLSLMELLRQCIAFSLRRPILKD